MQENGLDLRAIDPRNGEKYSLCTSGCPSATIMGMIALAEWAGLSVENLLAKNAHAVASAAIAARDAKKTT